MIRGRLSGLGLIALLAWLVAYPIVLVLVDVVHGPGGWSLDGLRAFAARPDEWAALWASLWISLLSVAMAAVIGIPLGFVFERLDFPGRRVLGGLVALPAVLPPLVGVIAFLFLYGESGFIGRAVAAVLGRSEAPWRLNGAPAILLVHAYSMYVYFYLFTRAGLARVDASMLEAAAALGAGRAETLRRVVLPLLRPQLAAAAILVFMTALGSFSAPYLFGGGFRVMTTQIVASKLNGDNAAALAETAALAAVAMVGLFLLRRTQGARSVAAVGKGTAPAARSLGSGTRWLAAGAGWLLALFLLLPHLTLLVVSFVPAGSWTTEIVPPVYALSNYAALVSDPERLRPLVNSTWMAGVATVAAVGLALWAGRFVARRANDWRAAVVETLTNVPWAIPGTVLAIAVAAMFSVRQPWAGRWVLVGTAAILPLAYLIRNLPMAAGSIIAGFRQLDPSLDEAAAVLGAGRWGRLARVTVPLLGPAILAGAALAFATALGDFVTSVVLYTFDTRPIAMEILSALRQYEIGQAAAYGVILMVMSAVAMVLGTRR